MNCYFSTIQILFLICFLLGCQQNSMDRTIDIAVIDVEQNLGQYQKIPVSRFVTELEYIPLQTDDYCLIGRINQIFVTSTHIFVAGNRYCYSFSRDGRFMREIGRVGQGPGEYELIYDLSMDEENQLLFIEAKSRLLVYSWDGVFRRSINLPQNNLSGVMQGNLVEKTFFVRDNLFIGHVCNLSGKEPYNFILFDTSGQIIKSFENHVKFERTRPRFTEDDFAMRPFRLSESIYIKEYAIDTLYCLNERNELVPKFVFNLGKYAFHKEKRGDDMLGSLGSFIIPLRERPIIGSSKSIFFSIWPRGVNTPYPKGRVGKSESFGRVNEYEDNFPVGIYDIANQKTALLDTDPVSGMTGLINDLDGGLSFWPKYYTSDNELVDFWQPYEMKEILTDEYFVAHEIKNQQAHQKLRELLKNLKDNDNPIIVIAKLKEK
jgi:hypothetical protein